MQHKEQPAIGRMVEGLGPMRDQVRQRALELGIGNKAAHDVRPPFLPLIGYRWLAGVRRLKGLSPRLIQESGFVEEVVQKVRAESADLAHRPHPFQVRVTDFAKERKTGAKTPTMHVVATIYDIPRGDGTFEFAFERYRLRDELGLEEEGPPTAALHYDWTLARTGMDTVHDLRPLVQAFNVGHQIVLNEIDVHMVPAGK